MAEEGKSGNSGLKKQHALTDQDMGELKLKQSTIGGIPAEPKRVENDDTRECDKILEEMKQMHKKYENIINKIKGSEGQLFLVKCNTLRGQYHFLARYQKDNLNKYFKKGAAFPSGTLNEPCDNENANKFNTMDAFEERYSKEAPMFEFKLLHNNEVITLKFGKETRMKYEDFKTTFIPINEAFMYEEFEKEIINIGNIVGIVKPPLSKVPSDMDMVEESNVVHEIIGSEEYTDTDNPSSGQVEGDGTKIVDIELDDRFGGKKKKKRKKRSRSKKRRRRRKNNTKKN
jgi:hypothetical protein